MKNKISTIWALLFIVFSVNAQDSYTIRGNITDKETGEALIGAMLVIENIEPSVVSVSDYDGNFSLENIPQNAEKIAVSFMSYKTQIIENIKYIPGAVDILNLVLEKIAEDIDEVVINAKSISNTDAAINTFQKNTAGIVNGLSSQQMSTLSDGDAASALKRVSGVSVSDGKYIFIRGLSDRYSKVTLNGAEIPGLDPNKNTVQMDMFPSNIIDNIMVHKSFTPDLPASFTGGYVNVTTKSYPERFTLHFSSSFAYNPQTNLNNNFLSYEGGKYDMFGLDDGTRAIPEFNADVPFLGQDNDKLDEMTASFNKTMTTQKQKSFLNHSHAFSIGNQVKLFGKPFGFILSGSYSRDYKSYDNGVYARYNLIESTDAADIMNANISEEEIKGEEEIMMSFLIGLSYKLNRNNSLNFSVLRNNNGLKSARYREGPKSVHDIYMYEHTLGFQERNFSSLQLLGEHIFPHISNAKLSWISSYTLSDQDEPDLRFFNYDSDGESYNISPNAYTSPARFYREMNEKNMDNKIDIEIPLKLFNKEMKIKTGTAFTCKQRRSDEKKFDILAQQLAFTGSVEDYLADYNIGQNSTEAGIYGTYILNDPFTDAYNSYDAMEIVIAGFGMMDINITDKFKIIIGLRFENDYIYIENKVDLNHHKHVRAEQLYTDFLPVLNMRYALTKDINLRFVYAKTVARPAFREIAPYAVYDFKEGWRVVGNPDLERTLIDNIDLRWEKFGRSGNIISASVFYKFFKNPIELIDDPRASNPEFHYVNIDQSQLYGIELEIKKHLKEIRMDNFMIGGNFTYLKSEVEFADNYSLEEGSVLIKRPMYEQAPWLINTFLSYNRIESGLSSNLSFNMEGAKLAVVTKGNTPNIYKQSYPNMKFNVSKTIGDRFSLKISVDNIFDHDYKKTYNFENKDYVFQSYSLGRTYSFSVSYDIN